MTLRRENDLLRIETTHANLLLKALDAVLCVDGDDDPFAGVFSALIPVFECSLAIVLIEQEGGGDALECVAASAAPAVGSLWARDKLLGKALSGRIVTTVAEAGAVAWPEIPGLGLAGREPALYLPLGVRGRRGLMLLLRECGRPGFDRAHVALAKKFSLLASHAFAAKRASQTEAESHRLKHLTDQLAASQRALQHRANHDQLTGLPNRAYIQELIGEAIARRGPDEKLALAFIDLDDFKRVNDIYGHAAGDALLKTVSERVCSSIRHTDIFGRISGDEFVIVLNPVTRRSDISALVNRMRARLREPFSFEGAEIRPSASIGVAIHPMHGNDYETLRRHADMAMYRAKTISKGGVAFFNRQLGKKAMEKHVLEHELRDALDSHAFHCALQKKVDIRTGAIVGFEALLRWVDRHGAVRLPGTFLPLANELGLLNDISNLVVSDLARALPRLDEVFGTSVHYSVNVSPIQAVNMQFMQGLVRRLRDTGRAGSFMLELTEESLAATGPFQSQVLPLLRDAGLRLSIDDFGTGYSSLSTIADLTVDELKIDRSLISAIHTRPRNQSILRAIESLGMALGISVVAEGIETNEEKLYLMAQSELRIGQGYLFHKPQLLGDLLKEASPVTPDSSIIDGGSMPHEAGRLAIAAAAGGLGSIVLRRDCGCNPPKV
nr:EAL domain-containing protein [Shinella pollutisoli]